MTKNIITQSSPNLNQKPRVDFQKNSFDALVWQKGHHVDWERAIKCPCQTESGSALSNCKNCRGLGWIWTDIVKTRMVMQGMNVNTKMKSWSIELLGTSSITALAENPLSFMDRVTMNHASAIYQEVVYPKAYDGELLADLEENILQEQNGLGLLTSGFSNFIYTIYPIKQLLYIAGFVNTDTQLSVVDPSYYRVVDNTILFSDDVPPGAQLTIRYEHSPQYLILDISREIMQSQVISSFSGKEELKEFPIHAVARRSQYVLDIDNINKDLNVVNNIGEGNVV